MDPNQAPPVDPTAIGAPTPAMDTVGMASPGDKQQLLDMISKIEQKLGEFNAQKFAGENRGKRVAADSIREVFTALQEAGVDIGNQQAVAEFIEKLRERNPDLANLFEEVVSKLLGEPSSAPQQDEMGVGGLPANEVTSNETIPEGGPGPVPLQA